MSSFDNRQNIKRDVKYIGRDFGEFRRNLINYAKQYFPNTYNDFNEADPGTMFIEMASYVGDVLSYYTDQQLRESLLASVEEKINLYNLAQANGYKVKTITPSSVKLDVYQLVPALGEGANAAPDMKYAQVIQKDMVCSAQNTTLFRTLQEVDFRVSSSIDPLDVSVYSLTPEGNIEYYLLKKQVDAVAGEIITRTYEFGDPKAYDKIVLPDTNVLEIVDIRDDDGNLWYEVDYLAQEMIPCELQNIPYNNPKLSVYRSSVPYLLCFKQTEKRFVTRLRKDDLSEIQFGAGLSNEADEEIVPNPMNVGIGLQYFERTVDLSIDPRNFMFTRTYGLAPNNTTLTVRYTIGGGISSNVPANSINVIDSIGFIDPVDVLDPTLLQVVQDSVAINNPEPAFGGGNTRELDRVRLEAMANFAAQNRTVTRTDYLLRCYSMPARFGMIAKAFIIQDEQIRTTNLEDRIPNQFALNLYVLAYNDNMQFVQANPALKENLRNFLKKYRMMTDAINIKDAHIINLGIEYEIIIRSNYNSNEVLLRCHQRLKELLCNDRMEINQPIFIGNISAELDKIEGVQTVVDFKFTNLFDRDQGYSGNFYDVETATRNNILYPSMDPSIFEIKFPEKDIRGRVTDF